MDQPTAGVVKMLPEIYPAIWQSRFSRKRRNCSGAVQRSVKSKRVLFARWSKLEAGGGVGDKIMHGSKYVIP